MKQAQRVGSFAYPRTPKGVSGEWGKWTYMEKMAGESNSEFAYRLKPSRMRKEISDCLVIHNGTERWAPPTMPDSLHHLLTRSWSSCPATHRTNKMFCYGDHARSGYAGQTGLDREYETIMRKAGLTQVIFEWSAPMPKTRDEQAEVDVDWMKVAEAYEAGKLGAVQALICRGPIDVEHLKPRKFTPKRSLREEFRLTAILPDFRDREAMSEAHFQLRHLQMTSIAGRWLPMKPLYVSMLGWGGVKYYCPPTGGDVLDRSEVQRWGALNHEYSIPAMLGSYEEARCDVLP
ncbi:hypothetical protein DIPPA_18756 [Diplonema papillatum]|nr:hypothetical protein DIPPA_18756 [Diplonema papillatum]